MIVYDLNTHQFKGLDDSGNWDAFTAAFGSNVVSDAVVQQRLENVTVASSCSSDPCTISNQSGNFASAVDWIVTGNYIVHFTTPFSGNPSCTVSSLNGGTSPNPYCIISAVSTTSLSIFCGNTTSGVNSNTNFSVICMGPQ
jgi:hypothetical protein